MLTVNWNCYHYYQKISKGPGGACVRRRGAPVPRHNGTMASPSLCSSMFTIYIGLQLLTTQYMNKYRKIRSRRTRTIATSWSDDPDRIIWILDPDYETDHHSRKLNMSSLARGYLTEYFNRNMTATFWDISCQLVTIPGISAPRSGLLSRSLSEVVHYLDDRW